MKYPLWKYLHNYIFEIPTLSLSSPASLNCLVHKIKEWEFRNWKHYFSLLPWFIDSLLGADDIIDNLRRVRKYENYSTSIVLNFQITKKSNLQTQSLFFNKYTCKLVTSIFLLYHFFFV